MLAVRFSTASNLTTDAGIKPHTVTQSALVRALSHFKQDVQATCMPACGAAQRTASQVAKRYI